MTDAEFVKQFEDGTYSYKDIQDALLATSESPEGSNEHAYVIVALALADFQELCRLILVYGDTDGGVMTSIRMTNTRLANTIESFSAGESDNRSELIGELRDILL